MKYPPGDYLSHLLLAEIWSLLATYMSGGKGRRYAALDIAPWLRPLLEQSFKHAVTQDRVQTARNALAQIRGSYAVRT